MPLITLDVDPELRFAPLYSINSEYGSKLKISSPQLDQRSNNTEHFPAKFPPLVVRDSANAEMEFPAQQLDAPSEQIEDGGTFSKVQCTLPHEALGLVVSDREDTESALDMAQTPRDSQLIPIRQQSKYMQQPKMQNLGGNAEQRTTVLQVEKSNDEEPLPLPTISHYVSSQINEDEEVSRVEHNVNDSLDSEFAASFTQQIDRDTFSSADTEKVMKVVRNPATPSTRVDCRPRIVRSKENKESSFKYEDLTLDGNLDEEVGEEHMILQEYQKKIVPSHHVSSATDQVTKHESSKFKDREYERIESQGLHSVKIDPVRVEVKGARDYSSANLITDVNEGAEVAQSVEQDNSSDNFSEQFIEDVDWELLLRQRRRDGTIQMSFAFFTDIRQIESSVLTSSVYFGSGLNDDGSQFTCSDNVHKKITAMSRASNKFPNKIKKSFADSKVSPTEIVRIKAQLAEVKRKREEASGANNETGKKSLEIWASPTLLKTELFSLNSICDDDCIKRNEIKQDSYVSKQPLKKSATDIHQERNDSQVMLMLVDNDAFENCGARHRLNNVKPNDTCSDADEAGKSSNNKTDIKERLPPCGHEQYNEPYSDAKEAKKISNHQFDIEKLIPSRGPSAGPDERNETYFGAKAEKKKEELCTIEVKKSSSYETEIKQLFPPHEPLAGPEQRIETYSGAKEANKYSQNKIDIKQLFPPHKPWQGFVDGNIGSVESFTSKKSFELKLNASFIERRFAINQIEKAPFSNRFERLLGLKKKSLVNQPRKKHNLIDPEISKETKSCFTRGRLKFPEIPDIAIGESNMCFERHTSAPPSISLRGCRL